MSGERGNLARIWTTGSISMMRKSDGERITQSTGEGIELPTPGMWRETGRFKGIETIEDEGG